LTSGAILVTQKEHKNVLEGKNGQTGLDVSCDGVLKKVGFEGNLFIAGTGGGDGKEGYRENYSS